MTLMLCLPIPSIFLKSKTMTSQAYFTKFLLLTVGAFSAFGAYAQTCASVTEMAQLQAVKNAYAKDDIEISASKGLKKSFRQDEQCVEKTGGLCNLDFDTLFASQDSPSINEAKLTYQCKPNHVIVDIMDKRKGVAKQDRLTRVDFSMVLENRSWRIDDAQYSAPSRKDNVSPFGLRQTLSTPIE